MVAFRHSEMTAKIAYFAHDLTDPAVQRRVRMLAAGGAIVAPIGFRRGREPVTAIEGFPAVEIGRSADGRLLKRALSVVAASANLGTTARHVAGSNAIIARNLEMLLLAARARNRYAPEAKLVYECLDIHRILLSGGLNGALLRWLESRLWRDVDMLLTSSPAFLHNYFAPRDFAKPIRLVENKLLLLEHDRPHLPVPARPAGPPWRIGWFGVIRCSRSLDILSSLAKSGDGAIEVIIRGRPSGATFPDFDAALANRPYVHYEGPYRNTFDLGRIYGDVHFVWAIDYYESGQNSAWLLPNRIYEGTFHGAVPIGLAGVETGAWLTKRGVGVVLNDPPEEQLRCFFQSLNQGIYAKLARAVSALPRTDLVSDQTDCRDLVEALCRPLIEQAGMCCGDNVEVVAVGQEPRSMGARQ
jgi:succinoglycan biosynthesis protein ExoL